MEDYEWFKQKISALTDIQLDSYKESQMKRRINTFISRNKCSGYAEYASLIESDAEKLAAFLDYVTINVTEFFRDPEYWQFLSESVVPVLAKRFTGPLKVWSTASSTGEEAYSLAMCFSEWMPLSRIEIIATDIDEHALAQAQSGIYPAEMVDSIPERFRNQYFIKQDNQFAVCDELKSCITFKKLDLLQDPYPDACHLIVCRNVLIYFTAAAKERIYQRFYESLLDGSYLFFGRAENLISWKKAGYDRPHSSFYEKQLRVREHPKYEKTSQ